MDDAAVIISLIYGRWNTFKFVSTINTSFTLARWVLCLKILFVAIVVTLNTNIGNFPLELNSLIQHYYRDLISCGLF